MHDICSKDELSLTHETKNRINRPNESQVCVGPRISGRNVYAGRVASLVLLSGVISGKDGRTDEQMNTRQMLTRFSLDATSVINDKHNKFKK